MKTWWVIMFTIYINTLDLKILKTQFVIEYTIDIYTYYVLLGKCYPDYIQLYVKKKRLKSEIGSSS